MLKNLILPMSVEYSTDIGKISLIIEQLEFLDREGIKCLYMSANRYLALCRIKIDFDIFK